MENVSETGYGVDVAVRRADDLDKKLLALVAEKPGARVIDIGCGAGGTAARLEAAGAQVTGLDSHDFSSEFSERLEGSATFICGDMRGLSVLIDDTYDFALCQRTIHYLLYDEAYKFLSALSLYISGKLFISFSGLQSDLARTYPDQNKPIKDRFSTLSLEDQETFGIIAPLCLYTKAEAEQLLTDSGWLIEESWQSAFGNSKLIATSI